LVRVTGGLLKQLTLPGSLQVRTSQDGRVAAARLVYVDVLGCSREQLLDGGLTKRGGARPLTLRVGLHLREGVLDPLAVLVTRMPLASPLFLGVRAMLMPFAVFSVGWPFFRFLGTGTRVDVREVELVGLGQPAQLELLENSF
jgi:hypothetical protein